MALPRRWRWMALASLIVALLAGLAWEMRPVTARPALWHISRGDRQAWLFGTIHAVPAGARWLSPRIAQAAQDSDVLVLEAAGLEAERNDRRVFETLGRSPGLPPIAARLNPADRARLDALRRAAPATLRDLDGYESWAAALLIGAATESGATSDGAPEDRFERLFRDQGRPVHGLETIASQLGRFDTLPEADQAELLRQAIEDADHAARDYRLLYDRWAAGDLAALEALFLAPLARAPHLKSVLIDARNALWAQAIDRLLRDNRQTLFVAVGAGHLLGSDSVQARLSRQGWRVARVQ